MKKYVFLLIPVLLLGACKDKKDTQTTDTIVPGNEMAVQDQVITNPYPENPIQLPDPCALIDMDELAEIFDIDPENVTLKPSGPGSAPGQNNSTSCFFIWDDEGINGGFLLQVMKNPLYGEFEDWASSYINVLKTNGETSYPDNVQYKYKELSGLGDAAVYNEDLGKVFWRLGQEVVVGMIFRDISSVLNFQDKTKDVGNLINKKIDIGQ